MRFGIVDLPAETQAFWREVSDFLDRHLTADVRAEMLASGSEFHEGFHRALGACGWILPDWSLEDGGGGLDPLRLHILRTEFARRHVPSITADTTYIGATVVARWGEPELRAAVLPDIAAGSVRICLGYTEADAGSDLAAVRTRAVRRDDRWVVNGSKMFTTGAESSQYCFLLARTNPEVSKHRGLTTFLVPLTHPGVEVRPVQTLGGERTNVVYYSDVDLGDEYRLGPVDGGWRVMSEPLDEEHGIGSADVSGLGHINGQGAWHLRTLRQVYAEALDWARRADGDSTPWDDMAVRHGLAEVALDLEVCVNTPEAMGRVIAADALIRDTGLLLDLVGPAGVLSRGADGAVASGTFEWGHRFAQASAIYGGTTDIHRNIIAERDLGLPRRKPPTK